jgi:site-specific recombinase XerD
MKAHWGTFMASLYKRHGSPHWWLKWRNPLTRKIERFSTDLNNSDAAHFRQAVHRRNQYTLKESAAQLADRQHPFLQWVIPFLNVTHANSPRTLQRYLTTWKTLQTYLESVNVSSPSQVRRDTCLAYVTWRKGVPHLNGKKPVSMNTIILELKVFSKILFEAVAREWIAFNPCMKLKLKRDPHAVKGELTDAQVRIIQKAIRAKLRAARTTEQKAVAEFFHNSFEIARLQGIRLSETLISMADVDLKSGTAIVNAKGNAGALITLNPALYPFFQKLKRDGRKFTYQKPDNPALLWWKFFHQLRAGDPSFRNISFHSARVTVVSRLERAGAPENVVMRIVLHSSTTVHRVYRRVKPSEINPYWPAAGRPSSVGKYPQSESSDAPPANPAPRGPGSSDHG